MSSWRVILNREDDEGSHEREGNAQSGLWGHTTIGEVPQSELATGRVRPKSGLDWRLRSG